MRGVPLQRRGRQVRLERGIRGLRQQNLADRRRVRRQTSAHPDGVGEWAALLDPRDVDHVGTVEDADTAGLARALHDLAHDRVRDLRQGCRGEIADAELEDPRGETPQPVVDLRVAEVLEGEEDPAYDRAGQGDAARDIGGAEGDVTAAEGAQHGDPALDALDPIARPVFCRHRPPTVLVSALRTRRFDPTDDGDRRPAHWPEVGRMTLSRV